LTVSHRMTCTNRRWGLSSEDLQYSLLTTIIRSYLVHDLQIPDSHTSQNQVAHWLPVKQTLLTADVMSSMEVQCFVLPCEQYVVLMAKFLNYVRCFKRKLTHITARLDHTTKQIWSADLSNSQIYLQPQPKHSCHGLQLCGDTLRLHKYICYCSVQLFTLVYYLRIFRHSPN